MSNGYTALSILIDEIEEAIREIDEDKNNIDDREKCRKHDKYMKILLRCELKSLEQSKSVYWAAGGVSAVISFVVIIVNHIFS